MIQFFRRIRQRLLNENRFSRYLVYALGEILLVVIGILIALQANNWNERRKTLRTINDTKTALISELRGHMSNTESIMETGYELASILDALRKGEYDHTKEINFGSFYGEFNLFDTFTFDLRQENLDKWIAFEKDLPSSNDNLIWLAKQLKHLMLERKEWERLATELSTSRFKEFVDALPWYYDFDSLAIKKRNDFFENDPLFRNKAIHYLDFQLNENVYYTTQVRAWTLVLLWRLMEDERGNSANAMNSFLEEYDYRPFDAMDCDAIPKNTSEFIGFRYTFLIYNPSDESRSFSVVNSVGEVKRTYDLWAKGLFPVLMYPGDFIQVGSPCESLFSQKKNGYYIIE